MASDYDDEDALAEVDAALTRKFANIELPARVRARILSGTGRVPVFPAILDLAGGMSVLAVLAVLATIYAPAVSFDVSTILVITSISVAASFALAWHAVVRA